MRLIVCGSETWFDVDAVNIVVNMLIDKYGTDLVIVHGGAGGAESIAHAAFRTAGVHCEVYLPNWNLHPKDAPGVRNWEMWDSGCDGVVAFWDNRSRNTADIVKMARNRYTDKPFRLWLIRPGQFSLIPHL